MTPDSRLPAAALVDRTDRQTPSRAADTPNGRRALFCAPGLPVFTAVLAGIFACQCWQPDAVSASQSVSLAIGSPTPVTTLTFAVNSTPDVSPTVSASPASFTVAVTTSGGVANWALQVSAANSYLDMTDKTMPIGNVRWTAGGTGFIDGALSTSDQTVAAAAGDGTWIGNLAFVLTNDWGYVTGSYDDTITYTCTAV